MLRLPDHWVWDSWYARDDAGRWHVFFLRASRALLDPHRRHRRAAIGHAVSDDLRSWQLVADALVPADAPAWDDLATWTGSTVRGPDGRWHLFYTGVSRAEDGLVQRIGLATSEDLTTWRRHGDTPLVEAHPAWYELLDRQAWYEQAWRDPWVYPDPDGDGWHMLITARANHGPADGRGVIGHATSPDLLTWTVRPPLTVPGGFGHLEVPQVEVVDGQPLLLFCTNAAQPRHGTSRIWVVPAPTVRGPWDLAAARPVDRPGLYAPRLVADADGRWQLVGFLDEVDGAFVGELAGPVPVSWSPVDGLRVESAATAVGYPA
ncbi:glycoside hydrolase family 68 protein [Asanoa sp. WMMD1127]|uniref:glycoside hydrolase family 68 protein n=1 Tax=Asanoa sp. WMMD1127 TaxID=3016107 RepID=UPI002417B456|nr:glycoside hydrolase family 68 protein [Asanoa sp. WMMD1127]MDG4825145.1 glycoside hydrolase family 68 protein [Asanoa sp. WMMD1127]